MELWCCRRLNLAHNLQILLLLGFMFCGTGVDYDPSVRLNYHYVDTVRFNCSSQRAFPRQNTSSFRMLQIKHFNDSKPRGDVWASIDNDKALAPVNGTMLKTIGERSVSVSGSINTMNVSWLQLTLLGPDLDMRMREYGKMSCSVFHTNATGAWTSKNITFLPGMRFPVKEDGFEAVNDSAVDLTCLARIPPIGGSQDATLTITRTPDDVTLASWNRDKNLQCLNDAICSAVHHVHNVYFYVKVRLMEAPKRTMHFRCSVQIKRKEYFSQLVQSLPDSQCFSDGDLILETVCSAFAAFLLSSLLTAIFFIRRKCIKKFVREGQTFPLEIVYQGRNDENDDGAEHRASLSRDTENGTPLEQLELLSTQPTS